MSEEKIKHVPINELVTEEGAEDLLNSPDMQPYVRLAVGVLNGSDTGQALDRIAKLPLEKRYVWRVASALKWGFADFDTVGVAADRETLPADDLAKVMELMRIRPIQFCLFLQALVGRDEMKGIMIHAIASAGRAGVQSLR